MSSLEKSLDKIELLLAQSMKGFHHLFDNETIAKILQTPTESLDFFNYKNMDKIQSLFSELIQKESYHEKIIFLENLTPEEYEMLVRTYFHILENSILASNQEKH
ncbi:MAG: hypothetical protein D6797_03220 [Bdellovibrio sp.]|nr:MAG: hypothetical protein D6797_03220 [Bdellovibrio sp.]